MDIDYLKSKGFEEIESNEFEKDGLKVTFFNPEDRMIISYSYGSFVISYECHNTFDWQFGEFAEKLKRVDFEFFNQNLLKSFDFSEKTNFLIWGMSNGMLSCLDKKNRMIEGKIRKYFDVRPIQSLRMDLRFNPVNFLDMRFKYTFNDTLSGECIFSKYNVKGRPKKFMEKAQYLFEVNFLHHAKEIIERLEVLR